MHWPVRAADAWRLDGFTFLSEIDNRTHTLAEKIWQYHQMKPQLQKADAILVLCSHDKKVAETGAQLFLEGWAPLLIFAGGLGSVTRGMWTEPEADQFAGLCTKSNEQASVDLIRTGSGSDQPKNQPEKPRVLPNGYIRTSAGGPVATAPGSDVEPSCEKQIRRNRHRHGRAE